MKKILHISKTTSSVPSQGPFIDELRKLGEVNIIRNGKDLSKEEIIALIRDCNILLCEWNSVPVPDEIADNPGNLEYICNLNGEMKERVSLRLIETDIIVTNWGDAPANGIAEGAMTLLLASLKDLHAHIQNKRQGEWRLGKNYPGGSLYKLNVGIYGAGAIGRRFIEMIRPFKPVLRLYDPYVKEVPEDCIKVSTLDELFSQSQAIVIHAALSEETRHSITAELLAKLPDHGIVVNTARGAIIDQAALFSELKSGRLRAGLDVLEPDMLPDNHEARLWENLILTGHRIGREEWPETSNTINVREEIAIDNIQRFINGQPLRFIMDRIRYLRST